MRTAPYSDRSADMDNSGNAPSRQRLRVLVTHLHTTARRLRPTWEEWQASVELLPLGRPELTPPTAPDDPRRQNA